MINIGVIGYGYWGPNIVRNFHRIEGAKVVKVCDFNPKMLNRVRDSFPGIELTSDVNEVLDSPHIDVVAVVTPISTHFELSKRALQNGKHVFVEKPFTATVAEAEELLALADQKKLLIMVDHTFLFTSAVRKIKELILSVELERRYSETRRRHPLAPDRPASDGIARERELIAPLRRFPAVKASVSSRDIDF